MLWPYNLSYDVGVFFFMKCRLWFLSLKMYCGNQLAIFIASNLVFHERTRHIEVDYHFIRDLVIKKQIVTLYFRSEDQLGNILTKPFSRSLFSVLCSKLDMFDLYAPA